MVTRREWMAAAFTVAGASRLLARNGEFWNEKESSKWSEREIDRLLTKSPWAKEVTVMVPAEAAPVSSGDVSIPGAGGGIGGIRLPGAGVPGLGGGRGRTSAGRATSKLTCIVRWESAAPILEALGSPLPSAFADQYVISVSGLPQGHEISPERLKEATFLRAAGETHAVIAGQVPGVTTRGLLFGFRTESVELKGQVVFQSQVEGLRLNAAFDAGEMMYRGALAV